MPRVHKFVLRAGVRKFAGEFENVFNWDHFQTHVRGCDRRKPQTHRKNISSQPIAAQVKKNISGLLERLSSNNP